MSITAPPKSAGKRIAAELGIEVIGREGHDLKAACIACKSSDGLRIHEDTGVAYCYVCQHSWSAWDLCKVIVGHDQAKVIMIDVGLFEQNGYHSNGHANGHDVPDPIEFIARQKGVTAEAFKAYGAKADGSDVIFPAFDFVGEQCTTFRIAPGTKGFWAKDQPSGLFFPVVNGKPRLPLPGETWLLNEGVKDASGLHVLGYLSCGSNGTNLNAQFSRLFSGCEVVIVPDRDQPAADGAKKSAAALYGVAKRVRLATLTMLPFTETKGADVRDALKKPNGEKLVRQAIADAVPVDARGEPRTIVRLKQLSSAELDAGDFTQNYLVDNLIPEKQGGIMSAIFKSLKTTSGVEIVTAIASGTPAFGYFDVPEARRAGIISCESGERSLQEIGRRTAAARGKALRDINNLVWSVDRPRLPDDLDVLERFIRENELAALFVDPSYLLLDVGDNSSNVYKMGKALAPITDLVASTGCAVMLCNHNRKNRDGRMDRFEPPSLVEISQSGFAEWARFWVLMGPRQEWDETIGRHWLWLRSGGSAGHAGLFALDVLEGKRSNPGGRVWEVEVAPASEAREAAQEAAKQAKESERRTAIDRNKALIVERAVRLPEGKGTKTEIRTIAGINGQAFDSAFAELIRNGDFVDCTILKGNNRPYAGYQLAGFQ